MFTISASDMDYCICSVHNGQCTNIQHIIFIFACFYICAVYVIFYEAVLARILKCVVLVCIAAVVSFLSFIVIYNTAVFYFNVLLASSFEVLQSLQLLICIIIYDNRVVE